MFVVPPAMSSPTGTVIVASPGDGSAANAWPVKASIATAATTSTTSERRLRHGCVIGSCSPLWLLSEPSRAPPSLHRVAAISKSRSIGDSPSIAPRPLGSPRAGNADLRPARHGRADRGPLGLRALPRRLLRGHREQPRAHPAGTPLLSLCPL